MVIRSLGLADFRNYPRLELELGEGVHFFYGSNGQGKTNLLEALYLLTHLRSYRTQRLRPLIREESVAAKIKGKVFTRGVDHKVELELFGQAKRVLLDQKPLSLSSEYIQRFFSILFAPDQLSHFKETPAERRSFFDRALCLLEPGYFGRLKEYERIKAQKNQLLRDKKFKELGLWNEFMAQAIPPLVEARQALTGEINQRLEGYFQAFSKAKGPLHLGYKPDLDFLDPQEVSKELQEKRPQEETQGFCGTGPHKDNYLMTMGPKRDRFNFSQGEYRTAFLALLFSLNQIFAERLDYRPLLLLDDLFSELDPEVSRSLVKEIEGLKNQVFITTTEVPHSFADRGIRYRVNQGLVTFAGN
ncbi:MAG: hypothetical protein A2600_06980 [Candidatus Lambdaproteobacteria bacterium RIFOXYD1_FULL_56_27]|uniref:DNA replication and repair protein RecF n=1 Tax=Candidatus Lambdaproteobacteria bacterium RIFOXYD2_FULL_56_26 TaxID=1817773 RepID=A0A1F6GQ31_9PROT|nr:MAG: hypothetical protein A2557_05640 [Candidatus Lambdaproteobacteria bacterium RIFOXYD2_FULL_56_26]OGH03675.1 MAG: hypothetical protein A2426_00430 [Candidatus Lambdaproteobacteria bacterium RIFOXYC1_FULL_56_13]OGH07259.1 MAG: hypothetical protein A2600_06980 [Candidatus Lambdaproteobacteria bacterium RIFOXYD1_FULL_56_27]